MAKPSRLRLENAIIILRHYLPDGVSLEFSDTDNVILCDHRGEGENFHGTIIEITDTLFDEDI